MFFSFNLFIYDFPNNFYRNIKNGTGIWIQIRVQIRIFILDSDLVQNFQMLSNLPLSTSLAGPPQERYRTGMKKSGKIVYAAGLRPIPYR
jgi:hypothetical protein